MQEFISGSPVNDQGSVNGSPGVRALFDARDSDYCDR